MFFIWLFVVNNLIGLLDKKETAGTCAQRELKEETGYAGTVRHISPGNYKSHFTR